MKNTLLSIYKKEGTQKVLASLLSIVIGLAVGAIVVASEDASSVVGEVICVVGTVVDGAGACWA